jgi:putative ABC transport system permease protein
LILGESLLLSGLGGAAGIVLTFPAAKAFAAAVGNWFPVFKVEALTVHLAVAAVLVVGVAAAAIPIWRVVSVRVVEGLGRIE